MINYYRFMWQRFKNFLYLITRSSQDPVATSLTIRGFLVYVVAVIMQWAPVACALVASLCIDTSQLNPLVDYITKSVEAILYLISYGMMIFGILRKIWYGRTVHPDASV